MSVILNQFKVNNKKLELKKNEEQLVDELRN